MSCAGQRASTPCSASAQPRLGESMRGRYGCGTQADRRAVIARPGPRPRHRRASSAVVVERPGRAASQRTRNSTLPSAPRSGEAITSTTNSAGVAEAVAHLAEHGAVDVGIAHDAALADPGPSRLELRLHQQHEVAVGVACSAASAGATVTQGDEGQVGDRRRRPGPPRSPGSSARTFVRSTHGDPRVVAQRPRELAAADVDRVDVRGAGLQQAVGEPAGGRAGVEGAPRPPTSTREAVERGGELLAARGRRTAAASPVELDRLAGGHQPGGRGRGTARRRGPVRPRSPPPPDGGSRAIPGARARRRVAGAQSPAQDTRLTVGANAAISAGASAPRSAATNGGGGIGDRLAARRRDRGGDPREHRARTASRARRPTRRRSTAGRPPHAGGRRSARG